MRQIQNKIIGQRIYSSLVYSPNTFSFSPGCVNCMHYNKISKKCLKYNTIAIIARAYPSKCGFYAKDFKPKY